MVWVSVYVEGSNGIKIGCLNLAGVLSNLYCKLIQYIRCT